MKRQKIRKAILLIALLLFPIIINYFSPYLIISGAAEGIIAGSFIVFIVQFLTSIIFGRAFCGWICSAGSIQDCCVSIQDKKVNGKIANKIKYIIWVPWLAGIVSAVIIAGGLNKIDFLYMTETGISVDEPMKYIMYFMVVGVFVILALTVGKRGGCHSICWMAPFMVVGNKLGHKLRLPSLHLKVDQSKCNSCKVCEKKCPMSLEVNAMVQRGSLQNNECILCGECVDTCPKKVIQYTFGADV